MSLLLGVSLALLGILAGIYVNGLIHDRYVRDLTAGQYAAMHQMRDKSFRQAMPPIALTTIALVALSAAVAFASGAPQILAAIAATLLVIDIALTIARQLPLNAQIQSWTPQTIPDDWSQVRDEWAAHHRLRTALAVTAYVCFLAAVRLSALC